MPKIDWSKAADLPPDELERLLEADADEVDEGAPPSAAELARVRPGQRRPGQRGPGRKPAKVLMSLRVAPDTLAAWRASGPGWQARADAVLTEAARKLKA